MPMPKAYAYLDGQLEMNQGQKKTEKTGRVVGHRHQTGLTRKQPYFVI
jgi:hypothetical protein